MRVATIPIGYADGLSRSLSNKGYVVINKHKCKILGNICMDSTLIDVTDVDCKLNDDVYIFDNDIIKLNDLSKELRTIDYEIISTINDRVEREYL
jgi:alanine racemase